MVTDSSAPAGLAPNRQKHPKTIAHHRADWRSGTLHASAKISILASPPGTVGRRAGVIGDHLDGGDDRHSTHPTRSAASADSRSWSAQPYAMARSRHRDGDRGRQFCRAGAIKLAGLVATLLRLPATLWKGGNVDFHGEVR